MVRCEICTEFEAVHRKDNVPVSNASQSYVIENNLEGIQCGICIRLTIYYSER